MPSQDTAAVTQRASSLLSQMERSSKYEQEMRRRMYPAANEVGLMHPDNHSALLLRDSGTIDLFTVPNIGLRIDPTTESAYLYAPKIQNKGQHWAGWFAESFAMESEEEAFFKTRRGFFKFNEFFKGKAKQLWQMMSPQAMVQCAQNLWIFVKTQVHMKADSMFVTETPDHRFETPVTQIGIQGHYLDPFVLFTQEMYDDLVLIKEHLMELEAWANTHNHRYTWARNAGAGSTATPSESPEVPEELTIYSDPIVKGWSSPSPMPSQSQSDQQSLDDDDWKSLQESSWS